MNGVQSVKSFGRAATSYQLAEAANGQWYFLLKASNGQVIAHGETYASKWNAQRAVGAVVELLAAQ
ncbi:MAG: YegP family protein [Deltaproteobacteria bacterium]|nr:YegP family protein [Deltaproteobacteria bacterium]